MVKLILYMAISADGYIATLKDETPWSEAEWEEYNKKAKEVGNVLIGRRTYELMLEDGSLGDLPCKTIFVLTRQKLKPKDKRVVFVNSIEHAVEKAEKLGFKQIMVAGGSKTNAAALNSGLVQEIFLDVEPILLGRGLPLVAKTINPIKLKLLGSKPYGSSGLQLHYEVLNK